MTTCQEQQVHVDGGRLWRRLMELAEIGAYDDPATGLRGVNRPTLSDADVLARKTLMAWMEAAGLAVRIDRVGNIYGRREGADPDASPVLTGSHIDTVATAGAFDGCLGVLGALEVIRTWNDRGIVTRRPVEVACFTEEEGGRFGTDMLGSAVAAGRIPLDDARNLEDAQGHTLGAELDRTGFAGAVPERLPAPHAYVECHIEQGPTLGAQGLDVGVVTGTQGISWQEITIRGRAAHAGATPTELRADAALAAAAAVVHLREMAESAEYGQLRATVGQLRVSPNVVNIIPAEAVLTVDLRNPDDQQMHRAESALQSFLRDLAEADLGLTVSTRRLARTAYVGFDPRLQRLIGRVADGLGLSHTALLSGAGHDAQELASLCPTGMIFVRGEHEGISHTPREYSTPEACAQGIDVLGGTLLLLADDAETGLEEKVQ
jgi:N-carbamoyl-L-amino-acid hydrolase